MFLAMISAQGIQSSLMELSPMTYSYPGKTVREVPPQAADISWAFPQRRNVYGKNIQEEEIGPELLSATIASKSRFVAGNQYARLSEACASFPAARTPSLAAHEQFGLQFERNSPFRPEKSVPPSATSIAQSVAIAP